MIQYHPGPAETHNLFDLLSFTLAVAGIRTLAAETLVLSIPAMIKPIERINLQ